MRKNDVHGHEGGTLVCVIEGMAHGDGHRVVRGDFQDVVNQAVSARPESIGNLKCLVEARLLQNAVGGVARLDLAIHREVTIGEWAVPDFVIALSLANPIASCLVKQLFSFPAKSATPYPVAGIVKSLLRSVTR